MNLFKITTEQVPHRQDEYLFDVDGWYDCNHDEYVKDGSVYRRVYATITKDVQYFYNVATSRYEQASEYLQGAIADDRVRWLANMVTYYRHTLKSWNNCWGKYGHEYRRGWFGDYDLEKMTVNERQKRKIVRLHKSFLIENGITVEHFKQLQNTDQATIDYINQILNGAPKKRRVVTIDQVF